MCYVLHCVLAELLHSINFILHDMQILQIVIALGEQYSNHRKFVKQD